MVTGVDIPDNAMPDPEELSNHLNELIKKGTQMVVKTEIGKGELHRAAADLREENVAGIS